MTAHAAPKPDPGHVPAVRGEGSSLIVAATHVDIASDRYLTKVAARLGARVEKNFGVGGSRLLTQTNVSGWALDWTHTVAELPVPAATLAGQPRPPREGLQVVHHGINDMGRFGNQAGWDTAFYHALLASVAQLRAGYVWQPNGGPGSSRFVTTGWTNASSADFGGPYVKKTSGPTTITYTTESGHPGGDMVFYIAQALGASESCVVSATITPSGGSVGPTLFTLDTLGIGVTDAGNPATPIALFVPDVPSGAGHVVTLTFSTIRTNINFLGATLTSEWPPLVLLVKQPHTPTMPPPTWPNATAAVMAQGNAAIDQVAAYFTDGKVTTVDLSSLEGDALNWVDDLHYTPEGHGKIANLVLRQISRAGGIPAGFSAGPVPTTNGKPTWSGAPGTQYVLDPATGIVWTPKTITAGDWVGLQPQGQQLLDINAAPAANDDIFQKKNGTVTNRTPNQYAADLIAAGLYTMVPAGTVTFSGLGTTLVAEPTAAAMVSLINGLGAPTFGTHAARIAAVHQKGVYWIETDTGLQYYDDGTAWRIVSPLGQVLKLGASQTIDGNPLATPAATTLRDITELNFPVDAGERWEVITHLWVTADLTTTDLKIFWTLPGGVGDTFTIIKTGDLTTPATGTNPVLANVDAISQGGSAAGIFEFITTTEITVGASAGTVQLRAAQIVAGGIGHDTIIQGQGTAGALTSSLRLRKLAAL